MKEFQIIRQGMGYTKGSGIYEESDGNHRCAWCNKKLREGQAVESETSPNSQGYRRHDTYYYHIVCPQ